MKIFALLSQGDDLIENAWRERKWLRFLILCLAATVGLAILGFVAVMLPGIIYLEIIRVYHLIRATAETATGTGISGQYSSLLDFALAFAAVTGLFAIVSAVPAMIVKELSGALNPRPLE